MLQLILESRPVDYFVTVFPQVRRCVEPCLLTERPALIEALQPLVATVYRLALAAERIVAASPAPMATDGAAGGAAASAEAVFTAELAALRSNVDRIIGEALARCQRLQMGLALLRATRLLIPGGLAVSGDDVPALPAPELAAALDEHLPGLTASLARMASDYVAARLAPPGSQAAPASASGSGSGAPTSASAPAPSAAPAGGSAPASASAPAPGAGAPAGAGAAAAGAGGSEDQPVRILPQCLALLRLRLPHLGARRKELVSALLVLLDPHAENEVLRFVLDFVGYWSKFGVQGGLPHKDRGDLLTKMLFLERRDDERLTEAFLAMVRDIYYEPALRGTELTAKLEPAFMMGLRWRKPELRQSFFQLYNAHLPPDLLGRWEHLLGRQSWLAMSHYYWMEQVVQFTLATKAGPIQLPPHQLRARAIGALESGTSTGAAMPPAPSSVPVDATEEQSAAAAAKDAEEARGDGMAVDTSAGASTPPSRTGRYAVRSDVRGLRRCGCSPRSRPGPAHFAAGSPFRLATMVAEHQAFLAALRPSSDPAALLEPLLYLCSGNRYMAHTIWIDLFPAVWAQLTAEVRAAAAWPQACGVQLVVRAVAHRPWRPAEADL